MGNHYRAVRSDVGGGRVRARAWSLVGGRAGRRTGSFRVKINAVGGGGGDGGSDTRTARRLAHDGVRVYGDGGGGGE